MFSGNQYARYDTTTETGDEGYPRILSSDSFPGLSFSQIDAAVDWGNGKVSEWEKRKKNAKNIYIPHIFSHTPISTIQSIGLLFLQKSVCQIWCFSRPPRSWVSQTN